MPKYVNERKIPRANLLTQQQLKAISQKSYDILSSKQGHESSACKVISLTIMPIVSTSLPMRSPLKPMLNKASFQLIVFLKSLP